MMLPIANYLANVLQDADGYPSSKRWVVILFVVLYALAFLVDLFTDHAPSQFLADGVMYVIIAGLGIVGAEKFAPRSG
jgi:hypothetical protein